MSYADDILNGSFGNNKKKKKKEGSSYSERILNGTFGEASQPKEQIQLTGSKLLDNVFTKYSKQNPNVELIAPEPKQKTIWDRILKAATPDMNTVKDVTNVAKEAINLPGKAWNAYIDYAGSGNLEKDAKNVINTVKREKIVAQSLINQFKRGNLEQKKETLLTGKEGQTIADRYILPVAEGANIAGKTVVGTAVDMAKGGYNYLAAADEEILKATGVIDEDEYNERKLARQAFMKEDTTGKIWEDVFGWDKKTRDYVNKNSFVTEENGWGKVIQGLTYSLEMAAAGGAWKPITFLSASGSSQQQEYRKGASDLEALIVGTLGGGIEVFAETMFGGELKLPGTGKWASVESLENALTEKISNGVTRYAVQHGFNIANEQMEEVVGGIANSIVQMLVYKDKKELQDLYSNEELMEDLFYTAITTALSGGTRIATQGGMNQVREDIKSGRSQITGYTQSEQKILDNEIESRIKEAEDNKGKKLSRKERANISEQVEEDFREGNISVDKIETTLGGENYQKLMDQQNKLEELKNKKKMLDNSKLSELTAAQNDQRQELKNQIEELENSTRSLQLSVAKDLMDKTSKSPLLQRSYYNANTLDTDTSKITNKAEKQTIENAKEAGIINKYKSKVETWAKLAGSQNTEIQFTTFDKLKKEGKLVEITDLTDAEKTKLKNLEKQLKSETNPKLRESLQNEIDDLKYYVTEGYKDNVDGKDVITINLDSTKATQKILMHEFKHVLEKSKLTKDFNEYLFDYATKKGDLERITNRVKEDYKDAYESLTQEQIDSEVSAKLIEEYLSDDNFVKSLNTKPTFKQKLKDLIDKLVSVFTPNSNEGKQLRELQNRYRELWNDATGTESVDNGEQLAILEKGRKYNYNIGEYVEGEQLVQLKSYKKHLVNDLNNYYVVDDDGLVLDKIKNNKKNKKAISILEEEYNGGKEIEGSSQNIAPIKGGLSDSNIDILQTNEEGWVDRYFHNILEGNKSEGTNRGENVELSANNRELINKEEQEAPFNNVQTLEQRVSGDALLDAQDLIEEIREVGASVDENGYVTLYHQTSNENATKIRDTGLMNAKEDAVYFSTSQNASQADGRGQTKLEFKIPAEMLELDDLFVDNADVKIRLNGNKNLDVSQYIVNNDIAPTNAQYSLNRENYTEEQYEAINKQIPKYADMTKDQLNREFGYASDSYQEMIKLSNDLQKEYKEYQKTPEFMNALQNYDFDSEAWLKGDEYADKIRYYNREADKYFAQREAINSILMDSDTDTRSSKQIVKDAEKHFGITNDFKETAYITTNGNQLDFSGFHEGGTKGSRSLDHRQINEIDTDMDTFIAQGNIRVLPESGGINLEIEPNAKQYAVLRDYIEYAKQNNDEIYVDVVTQNGSYDSIRYNKNTQASKIINDIKSYFENGSFPQQSRYADFLQYSISKQDSNGRKLSEEQQDYYKDSKVRDQDGNLLVMYNGRYSDDTVFKPSRWTNEKNGPTQIKGYFATESSYSEIYGDVSEYYLNIKNPLYMGLEDGNEALTLNEWQQFFKEHGITGVEFDSSLYGVNTKGNIAPDIDGQKRYLPFEIVDSDEYWNNNGNVTERIKAAGYDGLTWTEGGQAYMPFESNQIKRTDNVDPTTSDDIRYSISRQDNNGKELSNQQLEYFKNSKVVDDNNNLKEVYHRTYTGGFTVFQNRKGVHWFTDTSDATFYGDNKYSVYLNIENPLVIDAQGKNYNQIEFSQEGLTQYNSTTIKDVIDNIDKATKEDIVNLAQAIDKNNSLGDYIDEFDTPMQMLESVIEAYDEGSTIEEFKNGYGGLSMFTENDSIPSRKTTTTQDITDYAKLNGYDGVIFNNIQDMTNGVANVYAAFNSNQIKNVDNLNPTENDDIRLSMSRNNDIAPTSEWVNGYQLRGYETPTTYEDIAPINRTLDPLEISQLTPEDANTTPELPTRRYRTGSEQSSFFENATETTKMLPEEARDLMRTEENIKYYDKVTNEDSMNRALTRLNEGGAAETLRWFKADSKAADATDVAEGWILMKQYSDNGDYSSMVEVAKKMRDIGTQAGQTVQAFNIMARLTPEGMVKYAQSELSEAYDQMVKNKTQKWIDENKSKFDLTPDEVEFIKTTMEKVKDMEDGYEKKVELAKIQKIMTDKLPPQKGQGIKGWMRISMLFNPKTQVRNVVGNALIMPVNSFGDLFASMADYAVARKTGVRTTGLTKVSALAKGGIEGFKQATNDFKLGINTKNMEGNRFEIGEGKSFRERTIIGKSLNRTENMLNYVMDAGDRVFSQAAYENSIANQLKLNNTNTVTPEMIDIALEESLSRTWNDNNNYTRFVLNVRKGLNAINVRGYGLGDVLIPFAKTPANLTKAIVDYSPVGLVNTIVQGYNLRNNLQTETWTAQQQHQFVQTLGKATAGSMLYVLAYALAKAGIATGASDDDKDAKDFLKNTLGISGYSIKIGDKSFTYDWAQPIAAPLAIMTNIENGKDAQGLLEAIISSTDSASSVLMEQSFLQSLNDVLNSEGSFTENLMNKILDLPTRAVPTFVKQINDMVDGTQRQTFVYGKPLETAINKFKAKIPGLSQDLAPTVDTMGREVKKYGGKNNFFNVFLNPANVNTENISEEAGEIYRVYQQTGDKTILPRVAPYYINSKGEKTILTPQERAKFQTQAGEIIEEGIKDFMNSSEYVVMSEEDKAKTIKHLIDYAYNKARKDVVGLEMSNTYNKVNKYLDNGGTVGSYYLNKEVIDDTYKWLDKNEDAKVALATVTTGDVFSYRKIYNDISTIKANTKQDKQEVLTYVQDLDLDVIQKAIIFKQYYSSFNDYNREIIQYVAESDLSQEQKYALLESMNFKVNKNTGAVSWKKGR